LIALSRLDLAGQSGLLVYRCRAKEITSLLEQPSIHLATEEAAQMAENDENCPLKDFAAPKAIGIQLGYTVPNKQLRAETCSFEHALSTHVQRFSP
jgi:hypothetical protein